MKDVPTLLQTALDDPERYGCIMFTFTLGSNVYGLWTGQGEQLYNGILYKGGASILDVSDLQNNGDGSISEFTLTLNEEPDKGLTADVLMTFYEEEWHMQSIVIELGMRDPNTDAIIGLVVLFDGLIYQAPYAKGKGDLHAIKARCVSHAIRMSESGSKYRNLATQAQLDPTDTGLTDIGAYGSPVIEKTFKWGQA